MQRSLADPSALAQVLERVERLTPSHLPRWGRMSVGEMLLHLSGAFEMAIGSLTVVERRSFISNGFGRFLILRVARRWPRNLSTLPELDFGGTSRVDDGSFVKDRDQLARKIAAFALRSADELHSSHPLLGSMKRDAWMRWGFLHADHHLRQFGC